MEGLVVIAVIVSAVWVYIDAQRLGIKEGSRSGLFDMGPAGWALATVLLWIVFLPAYIYCRAAHLRSQPAISENYKSVIVPSKTHRNRPWHEVDAFSRRGVVAIIWIIALSCFVWWFAMPLLIDSGNSDIEVVKNSSIPSNPLLGAIMQGFSDPSTTIGSGIAKIAGVGGKVEWEAFQPETHKDNPDVRCVQVTVHNTSDKGKARKAIFQFLYNRSSKYIELSYYDVDGKPKTKLDAILALQLGVLK